MDKSIIDKIIQTIIDFFNKKEPEIINKSTSNAPIATSTSKDTPLIKDNPSTQSLTKNDLLTGRDKTYSSEYTAQISQNLDNLLVTMNKVQEAYGQKFKVNSGWRPSAVNASTPNSAPKSKHLEGLAVDIADPDGKLVEWILSNLGLMKELGLYFEDFRWTPTWCHFQILAPHSGNRIFIPSTAPAIAPDRWIGKYDSKYN